jgi:hypothetical protein
VLWRARRNPHLSGAKVAYDCQSAFSAQSTLSNCISYSPSDASSRESPRAIPSLVGLRPKSIILQAQSHYWRTEFLRHFWYPVEARTHASHVPWVTGYCRAHRANSLEGYILCLHRGVFGKEGPDRRRQTPFTYRRVQIVSATIWGGCSEAILSTLKFSAHAVSQVSQMACCGSLLGILGLKKPDPTLSETPLPRVAVPPASKDSKVPAPDSLAGEPQSRASPPQNPPEKPPPEKHGLREPKDLWSNAYDSLRRDDPDLTNAYEDVFMRIDIKNIQTLLPQSRDGSPTKDAR